MAFDRFVEAHPVKGVRRYQRPFRVHASILLFGVPIFKRDDVGAGCATVELGSSGEETITALQFAAGSIPARAHGLNRLGLMRELVIEEDARLRHASYSGFMTSSPEKSLDQGKQAIETNNGEIPCTLASGESQAGETGVSIRHFSMPRSAGWSESAAILKDVERTPDPQAHRESTPVGPCPTFLFAIRRAALDAAPKSRREFCHDGKIHQLITKRQGDAISGAILDPHGAKASEFEVWLDPGDPSGIPNRIEFRARSFLRLTFEAQPVIEQAEGGLPWVIDKQS